VSTLRALALILLAGALLPSAAQAADRPPRCPVDVPSAIVIEVSTGTVACATNPNEHRPIASTTKLMTALLTLERAKLSDVYTASDYRPSPAESQIGLDPGEKMSVRDLMRGLLVESANDAAVTLAEGVSGSRKAFVRAMNRRAQQLGLKDTHYANPIGLDDPGNYSSARDLVTLARVLRTKPFFRTTVDRPSVRLNTGNRPRTFANRNTLVRTTSWVNGVKSGHTSQAGYVLVGSGRRDHIQLISAVLGTPSLAVRNASTETLLAKSFSKFQRITAIRRGTVMTRVPIRYRRGAELALTAGGTVRRIVPRGQRDDVDRRIVGKPDDVVGPILAGKAFGAVEILQNGRVVGRVPLVAASSVPAADLEQKAKSWFTSPLPLLLVVALIGGTVLVARQLRRTVRNGRRAGDRPRAA
jgi:serine-type D-Ala-D-Ala carboxypeptidase (penicillin-binding protein 5/6)